MRQFIYVFITIFLLTSLVHGQSDYGAKAPKVPSQIKKSVRTAPPAPPRRKSKQKQSQIELEAPIEPIYGEEKMSKEDVLNEFVQAPDNHNVNLNTRVPDAVLEDPLSQDTEVEATEKSEYGDTPEEDLASNPMSTQENEPTNIETPTEETADLDIGDIEENLEEASEQAESTLHNTKRKPTQIGTFKPGMHQFTKNCTMFSDANLSSPPAGHVRPGRKLWVETHNNEWRKVFKKEGPVYIPGDCLE